MRRHTIRVVHGDPDHIELAAITAVFFILAANSAHSFHAKSGRHRSRRARWDRNRPLAHPAHSWRADPASRFPL